MKKFYLLTVAAVCALIAGCTPPEEEVIVTPPEQAYLAYFGFEAKEGVFAEDVKVESPATGTIRFETPVGTDAASYSDLVPVFAVTDSTAVVSDAEGNPIESGVAYDFSKDVDIYVTVSNKGGEKTSMYTISVQAKAALVWSLAAEAADSTKGDAVMAINPADGLPYIVTLLNSDAGQHGIAYKFDNGTLAPVVGNSPVFHDEKVDKIGLGFGKDGAVYTAFREYKVTNHTAIMKLDGTEATFVGDSAAFAPWPDWPAAIYPGADANSIWVAVRAGNAAGNVGRRTLSLNKWTGSAWETEKAISAERPSTEYAYMTIPVYSDDVNYLMTYNYNTASISLYKLQNDIWSTIFEGLKLKDVDGNDIPAFASTQIYSGDCAVASNGDVYICLGCTFNGADNNVAVIRYRPSDGSQTFVGGITPYIINKDRYFSLALDANDTPYLAFRNNVTGEDKLYVQYIDNKTKTWSEATCISSNAVGAPTIRFNESGKAFIAVTNADNKRVQIYTAN